MKTLLRYCLQPLILAIALALWMRDPGNAANIGLIILSLQFVLGALEYVIPARRDWLIGAKEKAAQAVAWTILVLLAAGIGELYSAFVSGPLQEVRGLLRLDIWPHSWPILVQLFMVFLLSELVWYWVHRGEHRFPIVWKASGHGAHHSFKKLNAINFGLNHPFELLVIVAPSATVDMLFGVGAPAAGAAMLVAIQASFAHSNLDLNSRLIGWVFTTNRYHIHHHSAVMEESNTNYGCAVILWDRVFGTFADQPTLDAGTGPTEPTTWQKIVMPFREPDDTAIAPGSGKDP